MARFFIYSQTMLKTIGNKIFKLLVRSNFGRNFAGNNDSVTFFKKFLVTTTGGVTLTLFPCLWGFWLS